MRKLTQADEGSLWELTRSQEVYCCLPTFLYEWKYLDLREAIRRLYTGCIRESLILAVKSDSRRSVAPAPGVSESIVGGKPMKNEKTSKWLSILALALALCAAGACVFTWVKVSGLPAFQATDVQYVLYMGTSVPLTGTEAPEDAPTATQERDRLEEILTRHFSGFTIQEACGGWTDDAGVFGHEFTFVIYLSDTTLDKVRAAADDLLSAFSQYSILIQTNATKTEFYTGK